MQKRWIDFFVILTFFFFFLVLSGARMDTVDILHWIVNCIRALFAGMDDAKDDAHQLRDAHQDSSDAKMVLVLPTPWIATFTPAKEYGALMEIVFSMQVNVLHTMGALFNSLL
jgi:hypothetical protein